MVSRRVAVGLILIFVVLAVLWLFNTVLDNPIKTAGVVNNPDETGGIQENTIEITSSGFSPNEITINSGEDVTWVNRDTEEHWPASAMHPTHTKYPGADYEAEGSYAGSQACVAEGQPKSGAFDPCKPLAPGETWTFTFDQIGSWAYHDHLVNGIYGKIIVQE